MYQILLCIFKIYIATKGDSESQIHILFTPGTCCADSSGLHPANTSILEPATCSLRTCLHSSWIRTVLYQGSVVYTIVQVSFHMGSRRLYSTRRLLCSVYVCALQVFHTPCLSPWEQTKHVEGSVDHNDVDRVLRSIQVLSPPLKTSMPCTVCISFPVNIAAYFTPLYA